MLTQKQIEDRKLGIGGSDVAAICGLSKYKTPLDVFLEKIGEKEAPDLDNQYIYWGNTLEPIVAQEFSVRTGLAVKEAPEPFIHPEHTFMRANIDRLVLGEEAILECKTASSYAKNLWGEDGTDIMPTEYYLQVAHYCAVLDKPKAYVAALIGGNDFRIMVYNRNMELEKKLIEIERRFWVEHVLERFPPNAQTVEDLGILIKEVKRDSFLLADNDIEEQWRLYKGIKEEIKALEEKAEQHKTRICLAMGDKEILQDAVNGRMATYKMCSIEKFNRSKFKEDHPGLYESYLDTSTLRILRVY